jgi:hypothetical protein
MTRPTASADRRVTSDVILTNLLGLNAPPATSPNMRSAISLCKLSPDPKVAFSAPSNCSLAAPVTLSKALAAFDGVNRFTACWMPNSDMAHEKLNTDLVKSRILVSFS